MQATELVVEGVPKPDFVHFYRTEKKRLIAFLLYIGASPSEADDLAQDAMVRLLPERWLSMEHPQAYLRKVAFHAYLRGQSAPIVSVAELPELPGGLDPVTHVELSELNAHVVAAVLALPSCQRTVMAFVLSGADANEIATALNTTLGSVYTNVSRARTELKKALGLEKGEKNA
ncbi:DNA-directed RNA polymerase specialized sigma24 family protein [Streptomyces sp. SAI-133]|uniref:RNA polymerase sigma factor n=1 Tax=unclassified Streptomyces TaxID=2593676 RepID=UPI002475333F|nr:sigma-70 family RNA polymerase sigma factor [Streptomyces sp. SAI-133]MDH6590078.1 DNA-directed RNA polymerase specialized sigma24 family protein [Streptomyces sp. SAI-133]